MNHKLYYATDDFHQTNDPIGLFWLLKISDIQLVLPVYTSSSIGTRRHSHIQDGFTHQIYQERMRPTADDESATIIAHLQFHIRHEIVHFEFLSRFFAWLIKTNNNQMIQDWIDREPTGKYARRVAFLYEFFTNQTLTVPSNIAGNYVDVLDANKLVTASPNHIEKNKRWRVNNNIAGTKDFAPMVVKTDAFHTATALDIASMLNKLNDDFGEELLMRASVWLTLGESKASFTIEGEGKQIKRIERFADFMARNVGQGDNPIHPDNLANYQQALLGDSLLEQFGVRQSPVFIGQSRLGYGEIVHYIAPPFADVHGQLIGLNAFMDKTHQQSSIMRSAVIAFGLVYIHPLADGNGRLHRFLFNDVLRRDGVTDEPMILPISKAIVGDSMGLKDYSSVLDTISKPLMKALKGSYHFDKQSTKYADGVLSNFVYDNLVSDESVCNDCDKTCHVWRFLDLTPHVLYLPDDYADRIIRSIQENGAKRSNKLLKEMPRLADNALYQQLVKVVEDSLV